MKRTQGMATIAAAVFFWKMSAIGASGDEILFDERHFFDTGEYVAVSGTLTGGHIAYPNNTYAIACFKDRGECWVTSIEQIGLNQIGRLENPYPIPVTRWDETEIVASEGTSQFGCATTTVTILRKQLMAVWVEETMNQTRPECVRSAGAVRKFTIEDSPGYKKLHGR
ncbi:MAG: hypothetical protein NVS2B5_05800 [Beijerinckiaceae bacterium]